ncbi:MAG: helix-turn-helix transcriptional regulator [Desulfurococcales archaeon]|nr:helix-turn-helix transcriptional regulator [Desulfurococcales archaeon]
MSGGVRLEEIFASKGRVKVIKELILRGEVNLNQLIRATGLNYITVVKHLKFLQDAGLVEELRVGRSRIYRPNWMDPRMRLIEEVMKDLSGE